MLRKKDESRLQERKAISIFCVVVRSFYHWIVLESSSIHQQKIFNRYCFTLYSTKLQYINLVGQKCCPNRWKSKVLTNQHCFYHYFSFIFTNCSHLYSINIYQKANFQLVQYLFSIRRNTRRFIGQNKRR